MKHLKHISLLLLCFVLVQCKSQKNDRISYTKIVKGTVADKSGMPLLVANIKVKDTARETNANEYGKFEIEVKVGDVLTVSFISMESTEVTIDSKDFYNIIVPDYKPHKTRKMKRWERKYARENHGVLPEW